MPSDVVRWLTAADVERIQREMRPLVRRLADWRSRALLPRGWLLYLFGAPLLIAAIIGLARGALDSMLAALAAFALLVIAARLLRRAALDGRPTGGRRYSPEPKLPRRAIAVALVGGATLLAASAAAGVGVVTAVIQALIAAVGCHLAYPAVAAGQARKVGGVPTEPRMRMALAAAEQRIEKIERAALETRSHELQARLHRIADAMRGILDLLASRPEHLGSMRRFINVHLDGAERVAVRYARTHRLVRNPVLERNYRAALDQIEAAIIAHRERLLRDDVEDLDIQIAVLRKQLRDEGFA